MASMLRSAGIIVHIDGDQHASVEVITLALGGHRLLVPTWQWDEASGVIREAELPGNWQFCYGLRRAILRFLASYLGAWLVMIVPAILLKAYPASVLLQMPLLVLGVPVNPQGPPQFFLSRPAD